MADCAKAAKSEKGKVTGQHHDGGSLREEEGRAHSYPQWVPVFENQPVKNVGAGCQSTDAQLHPGPAGFTPLEMNPRKPHLERTPKPTPSLVPINSHAYQPKQGQHWDPSEFLIRIIMDLFPNIGVWDSLLNVLNQYQQCRDHKHFFL